MLLQVFIFVKLIFVKFTPFTISFVACVIL